MFPEILRPVLAACLSVAISTSMAQPAISSLSPGSGSAGTSVTITGSGFGTTAASNVVYFGATRASVTSASAGSLTVTVPSGTTYQPVSVLNTDTHLTGFSPAPFVTTFTNPAGSAIGAGFFNNKNDYSSGDLPYAAAIGDLDGDGRPDVAVVNANSNTVSLFRNASIYNMSGFENKVAVTTGDGPISLAIGDVDGDGKPDLVVALERAASVAVYRNTASPGLFSAGSFAAPVLFAVGEHPYSIALADLDGDGRSDIIAANSQSNTISLLQNTGTAGTVNASSFAARVDVATGLNPRFVAAGDLDGDGKPEIAVANQQSNTLSVLHNTATSGTLNSASFATKVDFMTGSAPIGVAIGDLDGDGKADLAAANNASNSVSVFRNTTTAGTVDASSFSARTDFATTAQPFSLALGDINGDGKVDIAVANSVSSGMSVLRNTSAPGTLDAASFAANLQFATGGYPLSVVIGDLNMDGGPEVITTNGAGTLSLLRSTYFARPFVRSFSPASAPAGSTVTITGGNFNPVASANTVYFGGLKATVTGSSATSLTVTAPSGATYQPVTVLNNANGLSGMSANSFSTTFPNPSGVGISAGFYLPRVDIPAGASPSSIVFGDLDGDGKPDMATANPAAGTISVFRNISTNGNISATSFAAKVDFAGAGQPTTLALADMDGDGKLDIITANAAGSNNISALRNTSTPGSITSASFAPRVDFTGTTGSAALSIGIGDVDGDGLLDVAIGSSNNRSTPITIFKNQSFNGYINLILTVNIPSGRYADQVLLKDLDGDDKPELVTTSSFDTTVSVLQNKATPGTITPASFGPRIDVATGIWTNRIASGDLDGDGKPDLVISHQGFTSSLSVLPNTSTAGAVSFSSRIEVPVATNETVVALGDLDGDGKPDLAAANYNASILSVVRNVSTPGSLTAATFEPSRNFATNSLPQSLAIADIDGDGVQDIAVANRGSSSISLFKARMDPASPLAISSISPESGPAGTTVTINGTGFNNLAASNIVYFGTAQAQVTAATTSSLTVVAPSNSNYQPLSVLNTATGLSAWSAKPFGVTFVTPFGSEIPSNFYLPGVDFSTGILPYTMAIGDLDGDGKTDMAVVNGNANTVSVLRNTSQSGSINGSSFATRVDFATGSDPRAVALADVDGDGKLDIVVTNSGSTSVSVLRNTSASGSITPASFAARIDFATGDHPYAVALRDLDGDGRTDMVTANLFSGTVSIFRNQATPGAVSAASFAAKTDLATGSNPRFVALGDIDGDGKPDLAVVNQQDATLSMFRNQSANGSLSASSFSARTDFATPAVPLGLVITDIDGDGKLDLATANYDAGSVSVFRNASTAGTITASSLASRVDFTTGPNPFALAAGDANGDDKPDLLTVNAGSSTFSVLRNAATAGSITASSMSRSDFACGAYPVYLTIGDLDNDGKAEVATANAATNSVSVFKIVNIQANGTVPMVTSVSPNAGTAGSVVTISGENFNTTPSANIVYFGAVKAAVTGGSANSLTVTVPAGATYQPLSVLNAAYGLTGFSGTPFNLTFANPFGSGIPAGFYRPHADFNLNGIFPFSEALGDVNGDGKSDLLVANVNGSGMGLYQNTSATGSTPSFGPVVFLYPNGNSSTVLFSDMDGDGRPDIVTANLSQGSFTVLRNVTPVGAAITANSFAPPITFALYAQTSPYSIAVGDVDGDGKPDVAVANSAGNTVSLYRNLSLPGDFTTTSLAGGVNFATGPAPRFVQFSDLDGDKKPDMLVLNESSNTVSVYRNLSVAGSLTASAFAARVDFPTGSDPFTIAAGDLDGDGKTDIMVNNHGSNTLSVLRNTAVSGTLNSASFAPRVDFATGTQPYMAIIQDADGDGLPDLLSVNSYSSTVSVLRNMSVAGDINLSSFAAKVDFATGAYPVSLAAGDLNGDGLPEVLTGNAGKSTISILQIGSPAAVSSANERLATATAGDAATPSVQVFPNPTRGNVVVQLSGLATGYGTIEVLNGNGQVLQKRTLNFTGKAAQFTQQLSLDSQPAGVYFIKLTTPRGVQITKVALQR